jgi:hypothetical protein
MQHTHTPRMDTHRQQSLNPENPTEVPSGGPTNPEGFEDLSRSVATETRITSAEKAQSELKRVETSTSDIGIESNIVSQQGNVSSFAESAQSQQKDKLQCYSTLSVLRKARRDWLLFGVTVTCCGLTIYWAFNATLRNPQVRISENPKWNIGILNVLSMLSAYLIGALTRCVFERVRWAYLSQRGLSMTHFLALSPATGWHGLVYLYLFRKKAVCGRWYRSLLSRNQPWLLQRYLSL